MRNVFTRRRVAVGAAAAALVLGGATVLAYWTTGGTGSGSASTGAPTSNLAVNASVSNSLVPGGSAQPVDLTVTDGNPYTVDLFGDTATIDAGSITCKIGTNAAVSVPDSWFTLSSGTITNHSVTPATNTATAQSGHSGLTLTMNDVNADQDACQGAAVSFSITVASETGN